MPQTEISASAGVQKKPTGGVRIYDLVQRYEAEHIADTPKPTLLADLRNYLRAKGYGDDLMQMVFPDVQKPKNYPDFSNEVRPLRLFFDAAFYFNPKGESLGLIHCMQHGNFMLEGTHIYHNLSNDEYYQTYKESIDRYFINHQHELKIFKDAIQFLLDNGGEKLSLLIKYLNQYATGSEKLLMSTFGKMGATSMMNKFITGLDEKFALANKQMEERIALINQYDAKAEQLRVEINRDIPYLRDIKDLGQLFKLQNQTQAYLQRLDELKETKKQFISMLNGIDWYMDNGKPVNVKSLIEDCTLGEELIFGTVDSANLLMKDLIQSLSINVEKLLGEGREHATTIAKHLQYSIKQYSDMLSAAIEQEQKTYALLNSEQQKQTVIAQTNDYHNKIKSAVNEQSHKDSKDSSIYDMSIIEISTRSGLALEARNLTNSTNLVAIKKLASDCTQKLKYQLANPNTSAINKQIASDKIAALANRINEINLYTAAFNKQQAAHLEKITITTNNLSRLRRLQEQATAELQRIAHEQQANKAHEDAIKEAAKIDLTKNKEAYDHLSATKESLHNAKMGIETYYNEKKARESDPHKIAAAKNLSVKIESLAAIINNLLNSKVIQSSDVITQLKTNIEEAKAEFIREHQKSKASTFNLVNIIRHKTMNKDKVIQLVDGLIIKIDTLNQALHTKPVTVQNAPQISQPSSQRRMG